MSPRRSRVAVGGDRRALDPTRIDAIISGRREWNQGEASAIWARFALPPSVATAVGLALTFEKRWRYHRPMDTTEERSAGASPAGAVWALVMALRPRQWTKNLLVFFALFFTVGEEWSLADLDSVVEHVSKSTAAFVLFCAVTGVVYLVNDLFDVERDRAHPSKRLRPIASGALPVWAARVAAVVLTAVSLALSFLLEPLFGAVAVGYLALMVVYSVALKHVVLLDVFSISGGFVLRAVAGAAALHVPISPWLYACTALGALLIALGKRRSELAQAGEGAGRQRGTLGRYTIPLLDQLIAVVAPSTLVAYTLYTFTSPNVPENHAMMLTIPFVVYGLFRYVYVMHTTGLGEAPEEMLITDVPLIAAILLWLVSAAAVLLVFR